MDTVVQTKDGSNTLLSQKYNQHYHNIYDGAISESLYKHIIPAITHHQEKKSLSLLDICFGLGYNTLATIYYLNTRKISKKLTIFTPEIDNKLIQSLINFSYPKEFDSLKPIIVDLVHKGFYEDNTLYIQLSIQDAREYIKQLRDRSIDIVYQDAFSSDVNTELWTTEYFQSLYPKLTQNAIVTTYAVATPVRLAMQQSGLYLYENQNSHTKKATLGFVSSQPHLKAIDMKHKQKCNPHIKALSDFGN